MDRRTVVALNVSSIVRAIVADTTPLRVYPSYRRLLFGETVSAMGSQLTTTAVLLQIYAITRSSFAVGLTGLVALVPLIAFGLFGGSIADAVDRRRLTLVTSTGLAVVSLTLFGLALAHIGRAWPLYIVIAVQSSLLAIDSPGRRAMVPRLVAREHLAAATGLQQISFNMAMTAGPLLAGVAVAASGGYSLVYGLDAVTFVAALYGLGRLPAMKPEGGGTRAGLRSVVEGFRFLGGQPVVLMTFLVDIVAMVFGMPRALFPAIAHGQFGGGTATAGLLYSAVAAGALIGAVGGGWFGRIHRQGLAVIVAIVVWGGTIACFGLTHTLVVGVLLLASAGAADMVSAVFRNAILQTATPDELQGRLQGVFIVVVAGGPRLGDLESGSVASLVSPTFSVISGGLACIGGVLALAAAVPSFRRYDSRPGAAPSRAIL